MDELSESPDLSWLKELPEAGPAATTLPADGRFAGSYHGYVVLPGTLLAELVERTEAEPSAFGSFAAMGPYGSFELRHSDTPSSTALTTWPSVIAFYYANERHLLPILVEMGIPVIPLKKDFLHAYERVITELGQI